VISIKKNTSLIIFLCAIFVVVLYNFSLLLFYMNHMDSGRHADHPQRFINRIHIGFFNMVLEFIVFMVVSYLNFSWIDELIKRFGITKKKVVSLVISNVVLFVSFYLIEKIIFESIWTGSRPHFNYTYYVILNLSIFVLAMTLANFLILYRKNKITEIENSRLKEEKTRAELTSLKEQISPHFFFNTLSSLSSIVRNGKKEEGLSFIQDMSNTYRYALSSGKKDLVDLKEELEFLASYVYLLKKRFGEKLSIEIDVDEKFSSCQVPPMSLQVLVENAIQHNIITNQKPLYIRVKVVRGMLEVSNKLQEKEENEGLGLGLKNLSNRFKLLAQKDITIKKDENEFIVILPLL